MNKYLEKIAELDKEAMNPDKVWGALLKGSKSEQEAQRKLWALRSRVSFESDKSFYKGNKSRASRLLKNNNKLFDHPAYNKGTKWEGKS